MRTPRRLGPRRGFTLIEVVVALLVLEVALLALAAAGAASLRGATSAARRALAARTGERRVELVRAAGLCAPSAGTATAPRNVRESWTVTVVAPSVAEVRDSVVWPGAGGTRAIVVRERIACRA